MDAATELLARLNAVNDVQVTAVTDPAFAPYGRVLGGYDFAEAIAWMEAETQIPEDGNVYVASVPGLEALPVAGELERGLYGGMPIQLGYCNGRNTTINGFEYHKGSEVNVAVTDVMLFLGHTWEIRENSYRVEDARVFFAPRGTAFEMYQTTLHLSPCRTTDAGFKAIVVLPRGTNTPLDQRPVAPAGEGDPEAELLLQRNKWVIAHAEREPLVRQGAHVGLIGPNKELRY